MAGLLGLRRPQALSHVEGLDAAFERAMDARHVLG
jgi:hypothetical protein